MAKGFSFFDIGGLISSLYNIYQDIRNWNKMSPAKKEELEFQDEIADENAEDAFRRQREFQMEFLTPEAQLRSTAAGYDAIGLNRMMMAGGSPGASSASAPQASLGSASGNSTLSSVLEPLLAFSKLKVQKELSEKELSIQDKLATAQTRSLNANAAGQESFNLFAPQIYSTQVDVLKDSLNNNRVQRNLWRSGITANEAKASLDRTSAWLNSIQSRIASSDANVRDRMNFLTTQLYYWGVESAKVQGQFAERMAQKQLALISGQITNLAKHSNLLDEKVVETQIGYMRGYQEYQMAAPGVKNAKFMFWNDLVANDLKTAAMVVGSAYGLGKLIGPAPSPTFAPAITMPGAGASYPSVPVGMNGTPVWTP